MLKHLWLVRVARTEQLGSTASQTLSIQDVVVVLLLGIELQASLVQAGELGLIWLPICVVAFVAACEVVTSLAWIHPTSQDDIAVGDSNAAVGCIYVGFQSIWGIH